MRTALALIVLAACQTNFAVEDEFSRGNISLFGPPENRLASPYIVDATFDIRIVGAEDQPNVTLRSTNADVVRVLEVRTEREIDRAHRIATVRTGAPGEAVLQVVDGERVREAVPVEVAAPNRLAVHPIRAVIASELAGSELPNGGIERIDLLIDSPAEFELRPFVGNTLLTGRAETTVAGSEVSQELGSYRSADPHPIVMLRTDSAIEQDITWTVGGQAFTVPLAGHTEPDRIDLEDQPCDISRGQNGRCYVLADARTASDDRMYGVFPSWTTDAVDGWSSAAPGDVWSYEDFSGEVPGRLDVAMTLTVDARTFTVSSAVRTTDPQLTVASFDVEDSNAMQGCNHSGTPAAWLSLAGVVLGLRRRRRRLQAPVAGERRASPDRCG